MGAHTFRKKKNTHHTCYLFCRVVDAAFFSLLGFVAAGSVHVFRWICFFLLFFSLSRSFLLLLREWFSNSFFSAPLGTCMYIYIYDAEDKGHLRHTAHMYKTHMPVIYTMNRSAKISFLFFHSSFLFSLLSERSCNFHFSSMLAFFFRFFSFARFHLWFCFTCNRKEVLATVFIPIVFGWCLRCVYMLLMMTIVFFNFPPAFFRLCKSSFKMWKRAARGKNRRKIHIGFYKKKGNTGKKKKESVH